jgi:lipopolysaccharide/colanic/teichoic acid biosynthesis glycosyltransferase
VRQDTFDLLKRGADMALSAVALVVTLPMQAGVALLVRVKLGRPVLFRQVRPGRSGQPFTLVKFRTMTVPDAGGEPLPDVERLTRFGRALRATSLDELPTLWNVLRGDMSLVGPRALLMEYLPLYTAEQSRRHEVRPGITGLAQVSGRNALPWPERLALDVVYVDNRSMGLDLWILATTITKVLRREGITAEGHATVEKFTPKSAGSSVRVQS